MRVRILGIGMGPHHVTPEVAAALDDCDYVIAAQKSDFDPLLDVRRMLAAAHRVEVVTVPDPERDRAPASTASTSGYESAVRDWHEARTSAYEQVLRERGGTAAFLVWGDSSLYDSSIRIVAELARRLPLEWDVLPGISAPQLLAARHRVVLHQVGQPVLITTGRRLRDDVAAGHANLCVMLIRTLELDGLEDWAIWWGANLGADSEALVAGRVGDVLADIEAARSRAKRSAGWVMDMYLLRATR